MLTRKQHELLMFIHHHLEATGFSPSFDEMKDGMDLKSKSGVHRLITALEERGFLRRRAHRARALEVVRLPSDRSFDLHDKDDNSVGHTEFNRPHASTMIPSNAIVKLPLVGNIAAGNPIEAINESHEFIDIPVGMISFGQHYALTINGDSMSDAGILDGDTALIQLTSEFANGDIVVALIDSVEATIKKVRKRGNSIALEPCNTRFETRIFGADRVKIQGKLVGLMRTYKYQ